MNSFTLGKIASLHIQSLLDEVDEGRKARRSISQRLSALLMHHFHWQNKSLTTSLPSRATTK
ncbi:MAG: hypothetical protein JWM55_1624 [Acidimicrobiaceae bacterium]|nr:hypothetical protein [Acidimicrobiaceae bacterium]